MKKVSVFTIVFLFILTVNCFALQIGSIRASVDQGKWRFGIFNDLIQDKDFRVRTGSGLGILLTDAELDDSSVLGLEAAYGLVENLSVFLRAGLSEKTLETQWNDGSETILEYEQALLWGGGLRYFVGSVDDFIIVFNAQGAVHSGADAEKIKENGVTASAIQEPGEGKMTEYQGSIIFGFNFGEPDGFNTMPYIGFSVNSSKVKSDQVRYTASGLNYTIAKLELEEQNRFGSVIGVDFSMGKQFGVNVETRIHTEKAVSVGLRINF